MYYRQLLAVERGDGLVLFVVVLSNGEHDAFLVGVDSILESLKGCQYVCSLAEAQARLTSL